MPILQVFPILRVSSAEDAIAFYTKAFGAEEVFRLTEPSGRVGHAELRFGETTVMLCDEFEAFGILSPETLGGTSVALRLRLENVDAAHARALAAGAKQIRAPKDQVYGLRASKVVDPFGHEWQLGQEIETMTVGEMQRRHREMMSPSSE